MSTTNANEAACRIARRSPADFAIIASGGRWEPAPHLELLNDHLVRIAGGEITRLMVYLPPRHGKSELVSKYTTAWYLGMFPDKRIILTSYEADFAAQWGRRARDLLEEFGMVFPEPVKVKSDSSAANRWDIEGHTGGMITAGAGGAITGKGGQLIIIDDAIKNAEQAASQTYRDRTWEWYKSTLYTRLEPNGAIVLIQTRWHEDDLGGRLLAEMQAGGDVWTVINLPAIAEENDQLGRAVGEPLWPARFPYESLMQIKRTVGSYWWSSLYQQRPAPEEGEIFRRKWWQFYTGPPKIKEYIQSWDCSFKDEKGSDYVCGQVWGRNGADVYLMDWVHDRLDLPATMQAIKTLSHKWQLARRKLIEDKANGPAVIQMLQRKVPGLVPVEPHGGKIVRARAVTPYIESGNVYLPDPSLNPRIHDFIEECSAFPKGRYDDQVDAMTQALLFFIERGGETIQRADPGHTSQVPNIGYTHDSIPSMVG